jgi:hypothetical protein
MLPPRRRTRQALPVHSRRQGLWPAPRSWFSYSDRSSLTVSPEPLHGALGCASRWLHIRPRPRRLECPSRAMITWSWTAMVGKAILTSCVVGHRCLVVGSVQGVRGAIGNNPGGPAVNVLTQVITAVDITTIEEQAIKSCSKKD